jgi:GNAT superfamily N-acetyltransferase
LSIATLRAVRDNEEDAAFLYQLFVAVRATDMAMMPLDAAGKDFLLRMQFWSMTATYWRDYLAARSEVIEVAGETVGQIITDVGSNCVTYVDLALLPRVQRCGLGTAVMQRLLEEPRRLRLPARASVLEQNIASLRLFCRLGFAEVYCVPPYVRLEWRGQ